MTFIEDKGFSSALLDYPGFIYVVYSNKVPVVPFIKKVFQLLHHQYLEPTTRFSGTAKLINDFIYLVQTCMV